MRLDILQGLRPFYASLHLLPTLSQEHVSFEKNCKIHGNSHFINYMTHCINYDIILAAAREVTRGPPRDSGS